MMLLAALLACDPGSTDTLLEPATPPGTPVDPDVSSWSPDHLPVESASRAVYFGDSITAGYGINNPDNRYPNLLASNHDDRWPDFTGDTLTERYGAMEAFDFSRSGAETTDILSWQLPQMRAVFEGGVAGHTFVFMTIGGNDLTSALFTGNLDGVADDVDENLREIAEAFDDPSIFPDGATLFLANVYEPTDGVGQADECFFGLTVEAAEPILDAINANSLALAQEMGFAWVDLRGHFRGHGYNADLEDIEAHDDEDPTIWFQDDCIHPTARGHHELRRLFLAAVDAEPLLLVDPPE